jgi:glycine cleavage system regulatory protein
MADTEDPVADSAPIEQPKKLSAVSKSYDLGQKGYLDEAEQKLRALDTDNEGKLGVDKLYGLVRELQSAQKQTVSQRRIIVLLVIFALILALSNIGTSFAAARMAQQTTVENGNLLVKSTDTQNKPRVVGSTSVVTYFRAKEPEMSSGAGIAHQQELFINSTHVIITSSANTTNNETSRLRRLLTTDLTAGSPLTIAKAEAEALFQYLCSNLNWDNAFDRYGSFIYPFPCR